MTDYSDTAPRPGDRGPHPGIVGAVSLLLLVAGLVIAGAMSGGDALRSPFAATDVVVPRIAGHHDAFRVAAFFQLGSAVPLGIYTATVYARQLRLGVRVPGPVIGLVGGIVAVTSLFTSAFVTYVESRPEVTGDATLTHAGLGLLLAGIAVPAFLLRLVPRWLAGAGLVLAVLAELAWLSMLAEPLQYLIPIARFGGGLWLVAVGFSLPLHRLRRSGPSPEVAA